MPPQSIEQSKSSPFMWKHVTHWYSRFERPISSLSLIGGFVFDALTLKRVDTFWENFWVLIHLLVVAVCIVVINHKSYSKSDEKNPEELHFWLINILQFAFGGLLSTFLVFYFRSSSIFVSWPFLLILALAFAANERLKHHYARVTFQISFFFLSLFSFAIFLVPVIFHRIGLDIFLLSGALSLVLIIVFLVTLKTFAQSTFTKSRHSLAISITLIFVTFNFLYLFNFIPPIPLSLKDAGVYHSIIKNQNGNYVVEKENTSWKDFFGIYEDFHTTSASIAYVYSAIFSPTSFDIDIIHEWQKYDSVKNDWITTSRINLPVVGGREDGYRTYSAKENTDPGKWRVNVKTSRNQIIGRIYFNVIKGSQSPKLITDLKQ